MSKHLKKEILETQDTGGYWIVEYLGYGVYRYKCSNCGGLFGQSMIEDFHHDKYCADCGKKMRPRKK